MSIPIRRTDSEAPSTSNLTVSPSTTDWTLYLTIFVTGFVSSSINGSICDVESSFTYVSLIIESFFIVDTLSTSVPLLFPDVAKITPPMIILPMIIDWAVLNFSLSIFL